MKTKNKNINSPKNNSNIFKKTHEDKKVILAYIREGKSLKELQKKGFKFVSNI